MGTASTRYTQLNLSRTSYINRAERHAKVTIPALFPPAGYDGTQELYTPYQSTGSRCVNTLSAKLLMAMFPPNVLFFLLALDDLTIKEATGKDDIRGEIDKVLSTLQRKALLKLEASLFRPTMAEVMKQLVVAGNVCLYFPSTEKVRCFKLNQYVVKRSPSGEVIEAVIKEVISRAALPDNVREAVEKNQPTVPSPLPSENKSASENIDLYTHIIRKDGKMHVYQEVVGHKVEGSEGSYLPNKCPYLFLRFNKLDGEDYGRAYVEDYYGDLFSLEAYEEAVSGATIAMSKIVNFVDPAGSTRAEDVAKAENGDFVEGRAADITTYQVEKYNDLTFVARKIDAIKQDLAYAFLLNTAIQRPGERVTAEEIRYMARELEDVLGGVYSVLSQELQVPLAHIHINNLEKMQELPKLPKQITPLIVTGMEALGKGQDLTKLDQLLAGAAEIFGPDEVKKRVNPSEYFKRRAAALGVEPGGLILTDEDIAAQTADQALVGATPEMVRQAGALAGQAMEMPQYG